MTSTKKTCSFCEMPKNILTSGLNPDVYICPECNDIIRENFQLQEVEESINENKAALMKPAEIKAKLDEYIIGQEKAKRMLSVIVYNHYKRINIKTKVPMDKTNLFLMGESGSGKTFLLQTLSRILEVPFAIADASTLTQAGYVGEDVDSIIAKLYRAADGDIEKTERGIIYLDEVDKIATKSGNGTRSLDVSGQGVQQALLKILEGNKVSVAIGNGGPMGKEKVEIDTSNILFVCGGAFVGLEELIKSRFNKDENIIGFSKPATEVKFDDGKEHYLQFVTPEDVIKYGFIPEFVGRIPMIAPLHPLTEDDLVDILTKPKNALVKQYQESFNIDGVKLTFDDAALRYIANKAKEKKVGARGLRNVIENSMYDLMYDIPSMDIKDYTITEAFLRERNDTK